MVLEQGALAWPLARRRRARSGRSGRRRRPDRAAARRSGAGAGVRGAARTIVTTAATATDEAGHDHGGHVSIVPHRCASNQRRFRSRGRGRTSAPRPSAIEPAATPSREANGPHSWGVIHTWIIGAGSCLTSGGPARAVGLGEATDLGGHGIVGVAEVVVDVPLHQPAAEVGHVREGHRSSAACTSPRRASWCRRAAARRRGSPERPGRATRRRRSSPTGRSARDRCRRRRSSGSRRPRRRPGSDHCGRRTSVTATRFSAYACCSGVTPSTPDRSIGFVGS